jgi:hypothetical protein
MNLQEIQEAKERISSLKVLMVGLGGSMGASLTPEQYMAKAVEYNDAIKKIYELESDVRAAEESEWIRLKS